MRRYKVVDVFSAKPLLGNPVAVVLDAEGLDDAAMQAVARWTNLAETTFVLPPAHPDSDYRLRIFTPLRALPFAGHPTLGSAHAAMEAGGWIPAGAERVVQQCGVGLVAIDLPGAGSGADRALKLAMPPATVTPLSEDDTRELEAVLGHGVDRDPAPAIIDVGAVWIVAEIDSVQGLLALEPDFAREARFDAKCGATGVTVFARHAAGGAAMLEVRSFAPLCGGGDEDPVCGSGNGSVAVFLSRAGKLAAGSSYVAAQGQRVGRDGRIAVSVDAGGRITVGGACVTTVDGSLAA